MTQKPKVELKVDTSHLSDDMLKVIGIFEMIVPLVNSIFAKQENFDPAIHEHADDTPISLYPEDATKHEIEHFLSNHPEMRDEIMSHYTVVKRGGQGFIAVPYSEEYPELKELGRLVKEAITYTKEYPGLTKYLESIAVACENNDWHATHIPFLDAHDAPVHICLGFNEQYADKWFAAKSNIELHVGVRDEKTTEILYKMKETLDEFDRMLRERYGDTHICKNADSLRMNSDNRLMAAGRNRYSSYTAIAQTQPNDTYIHQKYGRKQTFFHNMLEAQNKYVIGPMAKQLLSESDYEAVKEHVSTFIDFVLAHECAHCLDPYFGTDPAYGAHKSGLEEGKADIFGFFLLYMLEDAGVFQKGYTDALLILCLFGDNPRQMKIHVDDAHAEGGRIMFNWFMDRGILQIQNGKPTFDISKLREGVVSLADEYHRVYSAKDINVTNAFVEEWAGLAPEIVEMLELVATIPEKIDPIYERGV